MLFVVYPIPAAGWFSRQSAINLVGHWAVWFSVSRMPSSRKLQNDFQYENTSDRFYRSGLRDGCLRSSSGHDRWGFALRFEFDEPTRLEKPCVIQNDYFSQD